MPLTNEQKLVIFRKRFSDAEEDLSDAFARIDELEPFTVQDIEIVLRALLETVTGTMLLRREKRKTVITGRMQ